MKPDLREVEMVFDLFVPPVGGGGGYPVRSLDSPFQIGRMAV